MSVPGGGAAAGVVIVNRQALARFPILTMHPGHPPGCCDWYESFDWKHDAVLLVVARTQSEFEIDQLTRRGGVLRVTIGPRYPDKAAFPAPDTLWLTVDVSRRLLGSPLPQRVVVAEANASR